jgi:hypothetical protein
VLWRFAAGDVPRRCGITAALWRPDKRRPARVTAGEVTKRSGGYR